MIITAKFEGTCPRCDGNILEGDKIDWNPKTKSSYHIKCPEEALAKKRAQASLDSIGNDVKQTGERPKGTNKADGVKVIDKTTIYGGGYWYVISRDWIWYVENNSRDGDDWRLCNVEGVGPGGIGWRVPYNEELAQKILDIANILNT